MSVTVCASPSPPTSTAPRRKNLAGKRTNSLGWAKADCHTCAEKQRFCDRRRPRCSACLDDGGICGGYIQALNWERATVRPGKSRSTSISSAAPKRSLSDESSSSAQLAQPSTFVFVDQTLSADRTRKKARKNSKSSVVSNLSQGDRSTRSSISSNWDSISPASPHSPWSQAKSTTPPSIYESSQDVILPLSPRIGRPPIEDALAFYHSRFSKTTLTWDVPVNPWQAALPQIHDDIPCVRYAAIALAQRQQAHLCNKAEGLAVLNLKAKALSIFAAHLNDLSLETGISTSLLLIALDYAETGLSNWTIHLRGALHILESSGGIRLAESRQNLRSQIAMLLWYDVASAMLSRCPPIFPRRYIETLMLWQSESEWSILGLNGLPDGMFLDMYDLAIAAAHPEELSADMVSAFEATILDAAVSNQDHRQLAAMTRVWKLGLLLYSRRVLVPLVSGEESATYALEEDVKPSLPVTGLGLGAKSLHNPHGLALEILSIVADLPPDSNFQKQCLMPIILASVEVPASNSPYRKIAVDYCTRWKDRTGIWIFDSALEFMSGVWSRNDCEVEVIAGKSKPRHDGTLSESDVIAVPWTEIYPRGIEYGFLFG
ncbi:hypothetical protein H2202_006686 [Exophiala xenobiotica]|nr:hypothetical protein H2202_006686 [Exophiala xenobiotica]